MVHGPGWSIRLSIDLGAWFVSVCFHVHVYNEKQAQLGVVHGPGPQRWSMDRVHGVVHGPGPQGWSMDPGPCFVYVRTIALFFWRSSERRLTKARSIQAESLKQFSCRKLCQPEFCIIRLGVAATKLPRSELVLDFKKFFNCFPGDLSSPKIFLCLVKYSSESIDLCERKAKKSIS